MKAGEDGSFSFTPFNLRPDALSPIGIPVTMSTLYYPVTATLQGEAVSSDSEPTVTRNVLVRVTEGPAEVQTTTSPQEPIITATTNSFYSPPPPPPPPPSPLSTSPPSATGPTIPWEEILVVGVIAVSVIATILIAKNYFAAETVAEVELEEAAHLGADKVADKLVDLREEKEEEERKKQQERWRRGED